MKRSTYSAKFAICLGLCLLLSGWLIYILSDLNFSQPAQAAQDQEKERKEASLQDLASQLRVERIASQDREQLISFKGRPSTSAPDDFERLRAQAQAEGAVRVIVGLRVAFQPEGRLNQAAAQTQRRAIAGAQTALLARLSGARAASVKRFAYIPFLALEVDAAGLDQLRGDPAVTTIEEDALQPATLAESVPLIGAPAAWAAGFSGNGQSVAILDTGVDKMHPFLANKVVSEACYSTTGSGTTSVCPGGVSQSISPGSGVNCSAAGCEHGTHVAGIAAGRSATFSGAARDANVIAIQVFSRVNGCTSSVNCVGAFNSDILLGLQRVQALSGSFNIAAANLSLGGGAFGENCDASQPAFKAAIDNLRSVNIATIVSSGNDANPNGLSSPACVSTAISVGATGDGSTANGIPAPVDVVASFSNSASFLNLLAPGMWINSSVPGGGFDNFAGTSMAAPHVAGAWAVLKSKAPNASVPQILAALASTGAPITDSRNGVTKPRIKVDAAATALSTGSCAFSLSPTTQSFNLSGGAGTLNVTASAGCAWTAVSNDPWISVTAGGSGSGPGAVSYSVGANTSLARNGTLLIAGQIFIVTQAGVPFFGVDDGSFENAVGLTSGGTIYGVNRLTPASYPATINAVAIYFPPGLGVNAGDPLAVLAGAHPSGSSSISASSLQPTTATVQGVGKFNIYPIPGITINSGDFVVGMSFTHLRNVLPLALDVTPPLRRRSYLSTNGTTYTIIDDVSSSLASNFMMRALPTQAFTCPTVTSLNPTSGMIGSTVTITGTGFTGVNAVKFANNVTAQFTVVSDTQITATVPAGAASGPIAIGKPNCADVRTSTFTMTGPVIASAGSEVAGENCRPLNGAIDPGEMVIVDFSLKNTGTVSTANLVATLQASGGVTTPGGPQTYGALTAGGVEVTRSFTFTVNPALTCGGSLTATLNLQDGTTNLGAIPFTFPLGKPKVAFSENFDGITAPALPAGWTSTVASGSAPAWVTSTTASDTPPNNAFATDPGSVSDVRLDSPSIAITTASAQLSFRNNYSTETEYDGGVLEIAIGAGAFTDIITAGGSFVTGGYTQMLVSGNPIAGRRAWSGNSSGYITTTVNLPASAAGQNIKLRWRMTSDDSVSGTGWRIDTIRLTDGLECATSCTGPLCPRIAISPALLPAGALNTTYGQILTASNGVAPYNFAVTAGALPGGLTLSPSGTLSGVPNVRGTFRFTITATDFNNCTGARSYTVTVGERLPPQTGLLYVLRACDGCGNQIYGYAVNETTGALTLLPDFPISTGGNGAGGASEELTIDQANQRLYAINDSSETVSAFAISQTTGALTPLPFSPISLGSGSWITIAVHPGGSPLVVGNGDNPGRLASYQITDTTATAAAGSPYSLGTARPFSAAFSRDGAYVYAGGNSGMIFAGLSVNASTGALTSLAGSPFNSGNNFPVAYATDAAGRLFVANGLAGQARVFTTASGIPTAVSSNPFTSGLGFATHGLWHPSGFYMLADFTGNRVGVYRINGSDSATTLTAALGSPFATGGSLTNALAVNQTGTLLFASNTSSRNLTTFRVNTATGSLTLLGIQPTNTLGTSGSLTGLAYLPPPPPCPTITLAPATLPGGTAGAAYNQTITASGGTAPYSFALSAGTLPTRLTLSSAGVLSGAPTQGGNFPITVTATDASANLCAGTQSYTLTINNPAPTLSQLNPPSTLAGGAAFILNLTGTNFVNGSVVRWNGSPRPTNFVSNTQLTAAIIAADIALAGVANITVFNPAPGGGTTSALTFTINNPVPTTSALNPNATLAGSSAFSLFVTGTNFVNGSTVRWNGSDRATTFISATQVNAVITAADIATAGTANVTVFNPAPGGGVSTPLTFTINNPAPTLTQIIPGLAIAGGAAFNLNVTGANFVNSSVVRWNGSNRTTTFVSGGQLTAAITAADIATAGTANITIFNPGPGGGTSNALTFTINNPVPVISQTNPISAIAGTGPFTLNVTGSNFVNGSIVRWNGSDRATTFVSGTQLNAAITAADIATAGTANITIFNPAPGGGTSSPFTFTINNPVPTISELNPNATLAGGAAFSLNVTGTNFVNTSVVRWNGSPRTTNFVSNTQLTAAITAADIALAGTANITVFSPGPGGGTSNASIFTINNPVPIISALNPSSTIAGGAAFSLIVTGTSFVNGSIVRWNGSDRTTTFISPTQVNATITAADIATAGTASVTVFNPAPGGGATSVVTFTINNPGPALAQISPISAIAGTAAFTLNLTGANFVNGSIVRWNGSDRATTFVSGTQVNAAITAADIATAGTVNVTVFNPAPGGGTSTASTFTINNPVPVIAQINPNSAIAGGGAFTLNVAGSNFVSGSIVRWNGSDRVTTVTSSAQLTAAITAADIATAGTASITIFNPAPGGGTSSPFTFTINNPVPTISELNPNATLVGGAAFSLNVTGTNFVNTSVVRWNGSPRTTNFVSNTQLTAAITAADIATAGMANVTVFNPTPGGGTSNASSFTINNPVPTIGGLNPNATLAGGSAFTLNVTGTNFVNGSVVKWNGSDRVTTFVSSTQLSAAITASDIATAGAANVTVFNPAPGGGTSSQLAFTVNNPFPDPISLNPNSATAGGAAFTLTIAGSNFVNGSIVRWNGSDRTTTFVSGAQLTTAITVADIATAGVANVTVFSPAPGGGTSPPLVFTINNPVPTIGALNPNPTIAGGSAFTLNVTGTNFVNGSIVRWNGSDRVTTFVSPTQVNVAITAADIATAGTANITVFNPAPGGGTSGVSTFTINNPVPTITQLSPDSVVVGGAAFTLNVTGTNFVNSSVVRWNGSDRTTTFVSATQLRAAITAADIATTGSSTITVFNPGPGGGTSNTSSFAVNNPVPTITQLNPNSTTIGGAAFTLNVTGTNFLNNSVVRWNNSDRTTTFVSATQLRAAITAADIATAGVVNVTVFNPAPGGGPSNTSNFTISGVPDLTIAKTHTGNFTVGGAGVYTLRVTNNGSAATTGAITVTDTLPNGLSFRSADGTGWSCAAAGQTVTCTNAGPLATGASSSFTLTVGVTSAAVPSVTNSASVSTTGDTNPANNSASDPTTVVCDFTVAPLNHSFTSAGGQGSVTVTTETGCTWTAVSNATWITVNTGASGSGNGTVTFTVAANTTTAGRTGTLTVAGKTVNLTQSALVTVVSAASFRAGEMAAESIGAAFGSNLATTTMAAPGLPLPTELAGTTVKARDSAGTERLCSLFFVAPTQANFIVAVGTANGAATVTVTSGSGAVSTGVIQIATVAPALFSANSDGQGPAAGVVLRMIGDVQTFEPIVMFDSAQNRFVTRPIDLSQGDVFLILFGSGFRSRSSLSAVTCTIGGLSQEVLYAGASSDLAGVDQLNLRLSRDLIGRGEVDVALTVDGKAANIVRVNFR